MLDMWTSFLVYSSAGRKAGDSENKKEDTFLQERQFAGKITQNCDMGHLSGGRSLKQNFATKDFLFFISQLILSYLIRGVCACTSAFVNFISFLFSCLVPKLLETLISCIQHSFKPLMKKTVKGSVPSSNFYKMESRRNPTSAQINKTTTTS